MTEFTMERPIRVYLAGPMRGVKRFNFLEFQRVAELLRLRGFEVFSPAERDAEIGFDPSDMDGHEDLAAMGFDMREALEADTTWICARADAVVVLDGWERSSGARAEVALARALGLPVWTWQDAIDPSTVNIDITAPPQLHHEGLAFTDVVLERTDLANEDHHARTASEVMRAGAERAGVSGTSSRFTKDAPGPGRVRAIARGLESDALRPEAERQLSHLLVRPANFAPVVGVTGRKRSGKNTAGEGLTEMGYEVAGFADELKDAALQLNPWVYSADGERWRLRPAVDAYGWEIVKDRFQEARRILQQLGTDVVRERDPEFWLRAFERRYVDGRRLVITDVRFDNEAQWVRDHGGIVVEIVRPGLDNDGDGHASEGGVSPELIDYRLTNTGTTEWLRTQMLSTVSYHVPSVA